MTRNDDIKMSLPKTVETMGEFVYKTCQRQPAALKLCRLIVHLKFYKTGKFENHVTRNDDIKMSLPKTVETMGKCGPQRNQTIYIYRSKGFDESYSKM